MALLRLKLPTLKYRRLRGDIIEVFKITHDIYMIQMLLLNWLTILILLLEETNINFPIIMTYESTIFLHVLSIFGIVYLTMLSMLILLTFLKHI